MQFFNSTALQLCMLSLVAKSLKMKKKIHATQNKCDNCFCLELDKEAQILKNEL